MAVADVWNALTTDSPYRKGMPREKAARIIQEGSGTHFDPKVVDAFLGYLRETYAGFALPASCGLSKEEPVKKAAVCGD